MGTTKSTKKSKRRAKGGTTPSGGMSERKRDSLRSSQFAFPDQRKEPLNDAAHVRNAISRFDQVEDVTDAQRDKAWTRIRKAAKRTGVRVSERSWRELGGGSARRRKGDRSGTR